jgi:hypothetical protein
MVRAGSGQVSSRSLAAGLGIPSGQPPTRAPPSTTQTALGAAVGAVYGSHDRRVTVCPYSGWPGVWGPHWRCCLRSRTASGYPVKCNTAYCSTTRGRSRARTGPGRTTPGRPGRTAGTGSTTHRRPGGQRHGRARMAAPALWMASMARTRTLLTASRSRSTWEASACRSPPSLPRSASSRPVRTRLSRWWFLGAVASVEWADSPHHAQHAPGVFR